MSSRESRLFIWPKGVDVAPIKKIVEDMELPYVVKPFWYDVATSEDVRRVLVLADGFENSPVVDYIHPKAETRFRESVEWALGILEESKGARLAMDTMRRIFGEDLKVWDDVKMKGGWSDVGADEREEGTYGR